MAWTREQMAQRAAQELTDGAYVNLGIGLPPLVANYIPDGMAVWLPSENGLLAIGPFPTEDAHDPDLNNAGPRHLTAHHATRTSHLNREGTGRGVARSVETR